MGIENQEALKEANKLRFQLDEANAKLAESSDHQETARDLLDAAQEAKNASEEELNQLNDKMALTNQMLYDAQNLASAKDAEIEDLKTKLTSLTDEMEGLKRDLKQSQTDKTMQTNEFEETLVSLESQVADLKRKNEHWQEQLENQNRHIEETREDHDVQTQIEQDHQNATEALIRKYEAILVEKEEASENETSKVKDEAEEALKKTIQDFNLQIADLRQELYEKSAMCDQVIETHKAELKAKQEEMEDEVAACNRMYQAKIAQVENDYEEQLAEMEKRRTSTGNNGLNTISNTEEDNSWNWEGATSIDEDAVQDLQRTPTREQRELQLRQVALSPPPATLSVVIQDSNPSQCNQTFKLEDASEFPYLKNVLYQYMLGKESETLVRVLATVAKFTPEELNEVIRHEEKKHSLLSSLGILPH